MGCERIQRNQETIPRPKSGLSKADGAECYFRRSITSGLHRKSLCGLRLVNAGLFRYWVMEVYPTSRPSGFVNAAALVRTNPLSAIPRPTFEWRVIRPGFRGADIPAVDVHASEPVLIEQLAVLTFHDAHGEVLPAGRVPEEPYQGIEAGLRGIANLVIAEVPQYHLVDDGTYTGVLLQKEFTDVHTIHLTSFQTPYS